MAETNLLKAKIGQMLVVGFKGTSLAPSDPIVKSIGAHQLGGVVLFDYNYPTKTYDHNIQNPDQVRQLTQELQSYNQQAKTTLPATPLFIGIDVEGGNVNRLKPKYGFPKLLSAAELALCSLQEAEDHAYLCAETLRNCGINLNFAPVLDVNVNPESPIIGKLARSFSSDPHQVTLYAGLVAKAQQAHGIISVYKHFPGHGSATGDTHQGFVDVTETWQACELYPYQDLLPESHCSMVMTAHVLHKGLDSQGLPASLSWAITQGLLRNDLNYHGVVITDDMQMKAITDHFGLDHAVKLAINAGADMLIFGNQLSAQWQDPGALVDLIFTAVQSGEILESRVNEAYERIVTLKAQLD